MKTVFYFLAICFLMVATVVSCVSFRDSDKSMTKKMKKTGKHFNIVYSRWNDGDVRYLHHLQNKPTLVFVHGAPGSSSAFLNYMLMDSLRAHFSIIIPDRPGYGYSHYGQYYSIDDQAEFLEFVLNNAQASSPIYLIGHSFGGPIVARVAMRKNLDIAGVIMVGGAISATDEKYLWFGKLGLWKGTRWLTSKALRVSTDEKYDHENQLRKMEGDWQNILTPVLMIHGNKDKLVPYANVQFAKRNIPKKLLTVHTAENEGHFIPFSHPKEMMQTITHWISTLNETKP